MLLTITTHAVVTNSQIILSNVVFTQSVLAAVLTKFAAAQMQAARAKCRPGHAMSHPQADPRGSWRRRLHDFYRACDALSCGSSCGAHRLCGCGG